jgi:hypothetical protein
MADKMMTLNMTRSEREIAKKIWDAERATLAVTCPHWPMPAWSKAPAWRRRPYLLQAKAKASWLDLRHVPS